LLFNLFVKSALGFPQILSLYFCAVGGAATAWTFWLVWLPEVCVLGLVKHKKVSVGAVFLFCYFYFGQAK
jgi:hypothetical protein